MAEDFKEGFVTYTVTYELPSDFSFNGWDDGYAAFSMGEKRMKDIKERDFLELVQDRVTGINGVEGYLMEVDLWRSNSDRSYEEISIEREDKGFLVHQWKLETNTTNNSNCYWRFAETQPRGNSILNKESLKSIEVIVDEHRLHFFITTSVR